MKSNLKIDGLNIEVTRKNVKNLILRVNRRRQRVALSCPYSTPKYLIKEFINEKKEWINKKLSEGKHQHKKNPKKYITGETHLIWGDQYELTVFETTGKQQAKIDRYNRFCLYVRANSSSTKREKVIREWYRVQIKREIPLLIEKWEPVMDVTVNEFGVKKMKTRWGTCNINDKRIWLNLELAKLPIRCLEYIVVHEMVHLLERLHNKRFYNLMDRFLPRWRADDKYLKKFLL